LLAEAQLELIAQRFWGMVGDQLQRRVGRQMLDQLMDDLVAEARFDVPDINDTFGRAGRFNAHHFSCDAWSTDQTRRDVQSGRE